jgi:hypothetical protein
MAYLRLVFGISNSNTIRVVLPQRNTSGLRNHALLAKYSPMSDPPCEPPPKDSAYTAVCML